MAPGQGCRHIALDEPGVTMDQAVGARSHALVCALTARQNRLRCGPVAPWQMLPKAFDELNRSHFLSFNAAPSNVVTIACIRPSLVM
jgi:hypothetical protein